MKRLNIDEIRNSIINISEYNISLEENKLKSCDDKLITRVIELVTKGNGYAICHGIKPLLGKFNLSLDNEDQLEMIRNFLEGIYHQMMAIVDINDFNDSGTVFGKPGTMDFDGINVNKGFTPNEYTPKREFVTTKCVHFDSAAPFTANIFGPNKNVSGGYTLISETNRYCKDNNVDPRDLVDNIPASYNCVVKKKHYDEILNDYSFAIKNDLENDLLLIVTLNEPTGGVAHGATPPSKIDESKPAARPIRHIESQCDDPSDYHTWFNYYNLILETADDKPRNNGEYLVLDYYQKNPEPFKHIVEISD